MRAGDLSAPAAGPPPAAAASAPGWHPPCMKNAKMHIFNKKYYIFDNHPFKYESPLSVLEMLDNFVFCQKKSIIFSRNPKYKAPLPEVRKISTQINCRGRLYIGGRVCVLIDYKGQPCVNDNTRGVGTFKRTKFGRAIFGSGNVRKMLWGNVMSFLVQSFDEHFYS